VDGARRELDTRPGDGRRGGRRRERVPEEFPGVLAGRAPRPDGVGQRRGGRRQPVRRDRAEPADRERRGPHRAGRPGRRDGRRGSREGVAGAARPGRRGGGARPVARRGRRHGQPDAGDAGMCPGRRHDRGVGRALREVFGEYRAPTGLSSGGAVGRTVDETAAPVGRPQAGQRHRRRTRRRPAADARRQAGPRRPLQRRRADRRRAPATPASRSSTRGSG
jgi:hypothetical protein